MPPSSQDVRTTSLLISALLAAVAILLFLRYTRLRPAQAALAWIVTTVAALGVGIYRAHTFSSAEGLGIAGPYPDPASARMGSGCAAAFVLLAGAFVVRLYRQWLDGQLTEAERAQGTAGLRAWLSPGNLFVAVLMSLLAWYGLGWSFLLVLVVTIGALVAWPVLHADHIPPGIIPPEMEGATREREKVLSLLESGKISADESAELLQALTVSSGAHVSASRPESRSILPIVAAALVLVGFLLPWFSFSPTEKLAAAVEDFGGGELSAPLVAISKASPMQKVRIRGGDIPNGLGWTVLVLALTSTLLPQVAPHLPRTSMRTFRIVTLGAGAIVLLYLLSQDVSSLAMGIILVLVGYGCAAVTLWREERLVLHVPRSAEARG